MSASNYSDFVDFNGVGNPLGGGGSGGGGTTSNSRPVAVVRDSSHMEAFYRDTSNNLEDVGWDVNSGWTALGIRATNIGDNPVAIARTSGNMDVFYRGNNNGSFFDSGWDANIGWAQTGFGGSPA